MENITFNLEAQLIEHLKIHSIEHEVSTDRLVGQILSSFICLMARGTPADIETMFKIYESVADES